MKKLLVGCSWVALILAATPVAARDEFFWPSMQGSFWSSAPAPNAQARQPPVQARQAEKRLKARSVRRVAAKPKPRMKRPRARHAVLAAPATNSFATKTQVALEKSELTRSLTDQMHKEVKRIDERQAELATRLLEEQKRSGERYAELAAKIDQQQAKPAAMVSGDPPPKAVDAAIKRIDDRATELATRLLEEQKQSGARYAELAAKIDQQQAKPAAMASGDQPPESVDAAIKRIDERYAQLTARLDDEVKRLNDQQAALTSAIQEELRRINARTSEDTASIPSDQNRAADPFPTEARYAELAARTAAVERDFKAAVEERQHFVQPAVVAAIIAALLSILSAGAVAFFHRSRTVADKRAKLSFELAAEYWRNMGLFVEALGILQNPAAMGDPANQSKVKAIGDFFERLSSAALSNHADPQMLDRLGMAGTLQSFWRALERSERKGAATRPLMNNWEHIKALSAA